MKKENVQHNDVYYAYSTDIYLSNLLHRIYKGRSHRATSLFLAVRLPDDSDCLYVYDAIYGIDDSIRDIMNEVAGDYGLPTFVK